MIIYSEEWSKALKRIPSNFCTWNSSDLALYIFKTLKNFSCELLNQIFIPCMRSQTIKTVFSLNIPVESLILSYSTLLSLLNSLITYYISLVYKQRSQIVWNQLNFKFVKKSTRLHINKTKLNFNWQKFY